jgi:hypothetical protein
MSRRLSMTLWISGVVIVVLGFMWRAAHVRRTYDTRLAVERARLAAEAEMLRRQVREAEQRERELRRRLEHCTDCAIPPYSPQDFGPGDYPMRIRQSPLYPGAPQGGTFSR